jgi:CheY-like chemotaxis protein/HPt (histidine-containing phosphotransfer) domain-containing protein
MGLPTPEVVRPARNDTAPSWGGGQVVGRLLLAEDNPINQKVAVAMLSSAGYQVDTVSDGAAAVQAIASQEYDAILMDCQMPELSGYEATAAIRAQEGPDRHTPIIAMTAGARGEDHERCLAAGMDGYLSKPVSKDALLALVARWLRRSDMPNPDTAEVTVDPTVFDELRQLGADSAQDLIGDLVEEFVLGTAGLLVELRSALEAGDHLEVSRLAHFIKGTSGQLGGRRLASSCLRLEDRVTTDSLSDADTDLHEIEADYEELCRTLTERLSA